MKLILRRWTIFLLLAATLTQGCSFTRVRNSAVPMVADVGPRVSTKHRYRISCLYKGDSAETMKISADSLMKYQPLVFSPRGIPVALRGELGGTQIGLGWTQLLSALSIGVFPFLSSISCTYRVAIEFADESDGKSMVDIAGVTDTSDSWLPTALPFFSGAPNVRGCQVFYETDWNTEKQHFQNSIVSYQLEKLAAEHALFQQALAYAIAVRLKELEDSGVVESLLQRKQSKKSWTPKHTVAQLERDGEKGFAYSFGIVLEDTPADKRSAFRAVLRELESSLRTEYCDTYPDVMDSTVAVYFSNLKISGLQISGRASVLSISPAALSYDPHTRCGKLSVRFRPGQEKEAIAWARRNINILARDKNIALTTGQLPPDGAYSVLEEKHEGNVIEITFKTE